MPALLASITDWYCPSCGLTDTTRDTGPHIRYHTCPKLRYLSAPMVRKGVSAKVELHEPEDYVGDRLVQRDPERRRPVMSITTTRADGSNDCVVLAPTATAKGAY
jgi:hypothetical protein